MTDVTHLLCAGNFPSSSLRGFRFLHGRILTLYFCERIKWRREEEMKEQFHFTIFNISRKGILGSDSKRVRKGKKWTKKRLRTTTFQSSLTVILYSHIDRRRWKRWLQQRNTIKSWVSSHPFQLDLLPFVSQEDERTTMERKKRRREMVGGISENETDLVRLGHSSHLLPLLAVILYLGFNSFTNSLSAFFRSVYLAHYFISLLSSLYHETWM